MPTKSRRDKPEGTDVAGTGRRGALEALEQVSQMVAGDLELDEVLPSAMRAAALAMDAEACSILLNDTAADALRFHFAEGPQTAGLESACLPINDESLAGWVAGHGEPLVVPDAYADRRFNPSYDAQTGFRTRSLVCVPLVARGKLLGVIQILNRHDGRPFGEDDLELAHAVASLVAVAILNAEEHEARLQAERLATVGQTVAGTAHCIKNILAGLQAGAYIINENLAPDADEQVLYGWGVVKSNMGFLSNIILDMLNYSRPRKPLLQPCDTGSLCGDIARLLGEQAAAKGVEIIAASEVGEVRMDETAIRRCLLNLVGNAIDACAGGGTVRLEAARGESDGDFILRVEDNGGGIEPEALEKIFDPFFSTKGGKGTGLGLPVTKKIVEEHGGRIRVNSTPGAGTVFTLLLPMGTPDKKPNEHGFGGGAADRHSKGAGAADEKSTGRGRRT
ncbi:MAG: ATP-binding protein [Phycisphaerae bacterium]